MLSTSSRHWSLLGHQTLAPMPSQAVLTQGWPDGSLLERDAAEAAGLDGIPGVVEVDGVGAAGAERLGKIDEDGAGIALVLEGGVAEEDFVDVERGVQIELDARGVLEHFEADGVLAAEVFLFGIDAHVEVVEEEIVVGAIGSVRAAQDVGVGGLAWGRGLGGKCGCGKRQEEDGDWRAHEDQPASPGTPPSVLASRTARRMDWATASAAATPRMLMSA